MSLQSEIGFAKVLGINLHKSNRGPWSAACTKFSEENFSCMLAQEVPNRKEDNLFHAVTPPVGVSCFYIPSLEPVRSAVIIRSEIPAELLTEHSDRDFVAVSTLIGGKKMVLVSAYLDGTKPMQEQLSRLSELALLSQDNLLLIHMDSNSRSHKWFDRVENDRGAELSAWIEQSGLNCLNSDGPPTFVRKVQDKDPADYDHSWIDLTLVDGQMFDLVSGWAVDLQDSLSDHRYIVVEVKFDQDSPPSRSLSTRKYQTNKLTGTCSHSR